MNYIEGEETVYAMGATALTHVPDTGQLPPAGSVVDLRSTNTRDQSKSQVQFPEKRQVL